MPELTELTSLKQLSPNETLDLNNLDIEAIKIETKYCVSEDIHDTHVRACIARGLPPITAQIGSINYDPIAVVCSGPSLAAEIEEVRKFSNILTCSGAHDFLLDHGIIPRMHMEADPRQHKVAFVKNPHKDVQYLIASCCHPVIFDTLKDFQVNIWHVLVSERMRPIFAALPYDHWMLTGGSNVGMRALVLARVLGYTNIHVFGMDCSSDERAFHVGNHPNEPRKFINVRVGGKTYKSSQAFMAYAQQFFKETLRLPDASVTLHGDGLLQALATQKMTDPEQVKKRMLATEAAVTIALMNPSTISAEYTALNRKMHAEHPEYGSRGWQHADVVTNLFRATKAESILDYGCGKGTLASKLPFPCWEYDPAITGKDTVPRPADMVVCADVLEHVEPTLLDSALRDLARCTMKVGYFVIHTGPASKCLPDGRNTHLIQKGEAWWREKLEGYFEIGKITQQGVLLICIVGPKQAKQQPQKAFVSRLLDAGSVQRRWHVLENLINQHGWTKGVEVGVKQGFTFLYLLAHCPSLRLTGVDLFEPRPGLEVEGGESHADAHLPEHEQRLRATVKKCYAGRAKLMKVESTIAAAQFKNGSLDFVFIDADHREAAVLADIAAWKPKIRPGGVLTGHDAQDKFPGVIAALNQVCPGWKQYPDSVWTYQC